MKRILVICLALLLIASGCAPNQPDPSSSPANEQLSPTNEQPSPENEQPSPENEQPSPENNQPSPDAAPPESDSPKLKVPPWDDTDSVQAKGDLMEVLTAAGLTEEEAAQVDSVLQAYFSIHAAVLVGKSPEDSELIAEDVADDAFKWATREYEFWQSRIVGCLVEYEVESVQIDPDTGEYVLAVREDIWEHYNRSDTAGTALEHEITISKTDSGTLCMTKQSSNWYWCDEWR